MMACGSHTPTDLKLNMTIRRLEKSEHFSVSLSFQVEIHLT